MASKSRKPRKGTHPYIVWGDAPGFVNGVCEWTSAMTKAQAILQVAEDLKVRHPGTVIYLGNCTAERRERPQPAKNGAEQAQMNLLQ